MAQIHNIPPQAYTRDTLVKAIDWLNHQPNSMREKAPSADALVSLYLQAKRRTNDFQNEAPISGENFKNDLKSLAEDLKQFEESPPQQSIPNNSAPVGGVPVRGTPAEVPPPPPIVLALPPQPKNQGWSVDSRSLSAAREIQHRLNLGSESEALRFLISLGIERARQMFP